MGLQSTQSMGMGLQSTLEHGNETVVAQILGSMGMGLQLFQCLGTWDCGMHQQSTVCIAMLFLLQAFCLPIIQIVHETIRDRKAGRISGTGAAPPTAGEDSAAERHFQLLHAWWCYILVAMAIMAPPLLLNRH